MVPRHHLSFCACNTAWLAPESLVSIGPSPHLWFLHAKHWLLDSNNKSLWIPALICGFCIQNTDFWTGITSLYGSQTSPIALFMQDSMIRPRITSLYGSQHTSVVFACKTATFGTEILVSMGPRPHLSLCSCKTAWLEPELLVSMGLSTHLWFLHAKQRLLEPKY